MHDITQLRVLIGSSGHFMPKRSWILPLDETIHIPSFLDELITSPDKFLKTGVHGWGRGILHIMIYAGRPAREKDTIFHLKDSAFTAVERNAKF